MITSTSQLICYALVDAKMNKSQLANKLGMSRQALYGRLETGKFTY